MSKPKWEDVAIAGVLPYVVRGRNGEERVGLMVSEKILEVLRAHLPGCIRPSRAWNDAYGRPPLTKT
jgi:hypothetical protein